MNSKSLVNCFVSTINNILRKKNWGGGGWPKNYTIGLCTDAHFSDHSLLTLDLPFKVNILQEVWGTFTDVWETECSTFQNIEAGLIHILQYTIPWLLACPDTCTNLGQYTTDLHSCGKCAYKLVARNMCLVMSNFWIVHEMRCCQFTHCPAKFTPKLRNVHAVNPYAVTHASIMQPVMRKLCGKYALTVS